MPEERSSANINTGPYKRCTSVQNCFGWQPHCFLQAYILSVMQTDPAGVSTVPAEGFINFIKSFSIAWAATTMATAFCGIGSPDNAACFVNCWLSSMLQENWTGMQCIWGIEADRLARCECSASSSPTFLPNSRCSVVCPCHLLHAKMLE